jgi:FRG domain
MPTVPSDMRVSSWSELQDELYEGSWRFNLQRFRSPFAFRGLSNTSFVPETTLSRLGGDFRRREQSLLRNFRKYAHRNAIPGDSLWNWIALAQHHGLPTRLLDWSFSPYVALHFATVNRAQWNNDAMIWCVDCVKIKRYLPGKFPRAPHPRLNGKQPRSASQLVEDYIRPAAIAAGVITVQDGVTYDRDGEVVRRFGFHNLGRHSLATFLMEEQENPAVVQAIMRHARMDMTLYYSHSRRKAKRAAQDKVLQRLVPEKMRVPVREPSMIQ